MITVNFCFPLNEYSKSLVAVRGFHGAVVSQNLSIKSGLMFRLIRAFRILTTTVLILLLYVISKALPIKLVLAVPHTRFICGYFFRLINWKHIVFIDDGASFLHNTLEQEAIENVAGKISTLRGEGLYWNSENIETDEVISRNIICKHIQKRFDISGLLHLEPIYQKDLLFFDDGRGDLNRVLDLAGGISKFLKLEDFAIILHPRRDTSDTEINDTVWKLEFPAEALINGLREDVFIAGVDSTVLFNASIIGRKNIISSESIYGIERIVYKDFGIALFSPLS